MGKVKTNKKLYGRMRDSGVRKKVARELATPPAIGSDGKRAPARKRRLGAEEAVSPRGAEGRCPKRRTHAKGEGSAT